MKNRKMFKVIGIISAMVLMIGVMSACANGGTTNSAEPSQVASQPAAAPTEQQTEVPKFDTSKEIAVVSREEGSGTRGAFIELMKVEVKDADGKKVDQTTEEATIANSTNVVMTTVASNPYAIGYISLGSLNDTVKALKVDGSEATVANIKGGTYKVARPFNIATKGQADAIAQDFINFIMSAQGQQVIADNHYIKIDDNAPNYTPSNLSGKVVVGGSSSVTPVMEKLKEAYAALNPNVTVEIQMSDSTTGMTQAIDGTLQIGMASRELKDSEKEAGLTPIVIAMDGIAVIANNENPLQELTSDQIRQIYVGEVLNWNEIE